MKMPDRKTDLTAYQLWLVEEGVRVIHDVPKRTKVIAQSRGDGSCSIYFGSRYKFYADYITCLYFMAISGSDPVTILMIKERYK